MYVSLDATDCPIHEQSPFDRKWYSHKINGPGLRYEIGLNIRQKEMVWTYGGRPCGECPDLVLAREVYTSMVDEGEKTIADRGYRDDQFFINPYNNPQSVVQQKQIMARHETVNKRLKQFSVLDIPFRHDVYLHPRCFHAVANITQLMLTNGEPLYSVR